MYTVAVKPTNLLSLVYVSFSKKMVDEIGEKVNHNSTHLFLDVIASNIANSISEIELPALDFTGVKFSSFQNGFEDEVICGVQEGCMYIIPTSRGIEIVIHTIEENR